MAEILNLQPRDGGRAKPYQVRQVRQVVPKYGLAGRRRSPMTTPKQASKRSRPQRPDHRYELIVYWSDPDDAFVVEVPELPGCMADGPTSAAAAAAAEVVILEWIETARELGRPIPEPRGRLLFA